MARPPGLQPGVALQLWFISCYTGCMYRRLSFITVGAVLLAVVVWLVWPPKKSSAPTINNNTAVNLTNTANTNGNTNSTASGGSMITFSTVDLPDRDPALEFSVRIPRTWRVEYLSGPRAINIYDPKLAGTTLQQSQLFVQYYTAPTWRTPSNISGAVNRTVTYSQASAQTYVLSAQAVSIASNYPAWWNATRPVGEVQSGSTTPYTFLVINYNPTIAQPNKADIDATFSVGAGQ